MDSISKTGLIKISTSHKSSTDRTSRSSPVTRLAPLPSPSRPPEARRPHGKFGTLVSRDLALGLRSGGEGDGGGDEGGLWAVEMRMKNVELKNWGMR